MHPMTRYATKKIRSWTASSIHRLATLPTSKVPPWIGRLPDQDSDRQMRTSVEPTHWELELTQADMEMAADEREQALRNICCLVRRHEIRLQELIAHLLDAGDRAQRPLAAEISDSDDTTAGLPVDIHCSLLAHVAFASKILRVPGNRPMAEAINDL